MTDLQKFEAECRRDIPLLEAMQLSMLSFSDRRLNLHAPLAPNINNKGTAFGGSIASICLFAGWAVSTLAFAARGIANTEIVVFRNEMTFERPARGLLEVAATIDAADFDACLERLRVGDTRRMRLTIDVELAHDNNRCASMRGTYVVWLKPSPAE